ncbi:MAG: HlyD family efflux transporter periplasmic adaptor subunit [Alphaproteobacteria bacterium]|nr:HlyD family efflux transporter periplasmic adaptor subunit [Alphaproteobacteria bacterium]
MKLNWRRIALWSALALALIAGLGYAFWPRAVQVDFAVAERGPLTVTIDDEGETRVKDVYVLSTPVTGRALRIESDVGDQVIAGETIVARIEPIDPTFLDVRTEAQAKAAVQAAEAAKALTEAELEQSQAELTFAKTELERAQRLIKSKTISQRALDDADRNFKKRKAEVARTEAALKMREFELTQAWALLVSPTETQETRGDCDCVSIPAPVSGRVLRILHKSAGVVKAGDPLVEIGNPGDLEIVVDLLSSDAVMAEAGQRVIIEEWGGAAPLKGTVRRVEPFGFTKISALGIEEQRVNVIIDISDPRDRWSRLGHGYRVETRIVLWNGDDVLKLPLTALFRDGDRWAVFVENSGRAQRRHVTLGRRTKLEAEIADGIAEGTRVVLHPSDRVTSGARITARKASR